MSNEPSITNIDDGKLADLINSAGRRVLFLSPGVSRQVAHALASAWARLGVPSVEVVIDADPEVCRLGYGTMEGLQILHKAATRLGTSVHHHPGIRIGLLIADDATLIFSPTPLLIEAGSDLPSRPNAIRLDSPPQELSKDIGLGDGPTKDRIVGRESVDSEKIQSIQQDLAKCPPAKFDLARRVRVFQTYFQFVELEMTGCYISRRKVRIPSNLMGLPKNVQSQLNAQYNLLDRASLRVKVEINGKEQELSEKVLNQQRREIVRNFLIPLKGYGNIVLRANKDKLIGAVKALEENVMKFRDGIKAHLEKHIEESVHTLVEALLPAVRQNPPERYMKCHGPDLSDDQIRDLLRRDLREAFGEADDRVSEMKVSLVFKDIAYESLVDEEFLKIAREAMPGVEFLHEEYEAAEVEETV